jgi:hypothetical protein
VIVLGNCFTYRKTWPTAMVRFPRVARHRQNYSVAYYRRNFTLFLLVSAGSVNLNGGGRCFSVNTFTISGSCIGYSGLMNFCDGVKTKCLLQYPPQGGDKEKHLSCTVYFRKHHLDAASLHKHFVKLIYVTHAFITDI